MSNATCLEENKHLLNFSKEKFYSADFSQTFEKKQKEPVFGKIILKKPFFQNIVRLDGDIIRELYENDLGYSESERIKQIKRIQKNRF